MPLMKGVSAARIRPGIAQTTTDPGFLRCARYVGRVGALAVALGAGAVILSMPAVAFADQDVSTVSGSPGSLATGGLRSTGHAVSKTRPRVAGPNGGGVRPASGARAVSAATAPGRSHSGPQCYWRRRLGWFQPGRTTGWLGCAATAREAQPDVRVRVVAPASRLGRCRWRFSEELPRARGIGFSRDRPGSGATRWFVVVRQWHR